MARIDQRLHFDEQRPAALARHRDHRTRNRLLVTRQKQRGRIADLLQTAVGHREHAEFVDRAEAIFDRAHNAIAAAGVVLEIQHRIDHMFEHARAGDSTFLGHVPDQHHRGVAGLGETHQSGRAFADLRNRAGRRIQSFGVQRLDRVDDDEARPMLGQLVENQVNAGLGQHRQIEPRQPEPARAQADLRKRFLARNVKRIEPAFDGGEHLQQQRRFTDARIAADQDHRARHDAASEHAIHFRQPRGHARRVVCADFVQALDPHLTRDRSPARRRTRLGDGFDQRVPGPAFGALPGPFGGLPPAGLADIPNVVLLARKLGHASL